MSTSDDPNDLSPEELAARFAEQLARTPVGDIMQQTVATLIDCAGIRLGLGPLGDTGRDPVQAKQAIEGADAMLGVIERELGEAEAAPFHEPLRVVKMVFVQVTSAEGAPDTGEGAVAGEPGRPAPGGGEAAPPEPQSAPGQDAASRLWVPPGTRPDG
jgi:hypothetical protein